MNYLMQQTVDVATSLSFHSHQKCGTSPLLLSRYLEEMKVADFISQFVKSPRNPPLAQRIDVIYKVDFVYY